MELLLQLLMLLVCWISCLKLSHTPRWFEILYALAVGLFIYWTSDFASTQTRDSIKIYFEQQSLREYITILLTFEVILLLAFTLLHLDNQAQTRPTAKLFHQGIKLFLKFYPPLLTLPSLLYLHTTLLFNWTGVDFEFLSLSLTVTSILFFAITPRLLRSLLPEKEIRLELLALSTLLTFILGLITTMNYHLTYKAPEYELSIRDLALTILFMSFCSFIGYLYPNAKHLIKRINK